MDPMKVSKLEQTVRTVGLSHRSLSYSIESFEGSESFKGFLSFASFGSFASFESF